MAVLLSEIQWSDPVLPVAHDVAWEAELKRRGAQVLEVDRRVAPSRWLREAAYEATNYMPVALPERLLPHRQHGDGPGEFVPLLLWREPRLHEGAGLFRVFHPAGRTRRADGRTGRQGARVHRLLPQPGAVEAAPGRGRACRPARARLHPGADRRDRLRDLARVLLQPRQHPDGVPAGTEVRTHGQRTFPLAARARDAVDEEVRAEQAGGSAAGSGCVGCRPLRRGAGAAGRSACGQRHEGGARRRVRIRGAEPQRQGADVRRGRAHARLPALRSRGDPAAARRRPEPGGDRQRHGDASLPAPGANAKPASWPGRATRCTTNLRRSSRRHAPSAPNWAPDALLEAIGVASLANATVRLAMLLE